MSEKLTFGELCEAIRDNKHIQVLKYNGVWVDIVFLDDTEVLSVGRLVKKNIYRIKPEPVLRYNWICKNPVGFWILGNNKQKYTREDAEFILKEKYTCNELVEPYLPSEESE